MQKLLLEKDRNFEQSFPRDYCSSKNSVGSKKSALRGDWNNIRLPMKLGSAACKRSWKTSKKSGDASCKSPLEKAVQKLNDYCLSNIKQLEDTVYECWIEKSSYYRSNKRKTQLIENFYAHESKGKLSSIHNVTEKQEIFHVNRTIVKRI